MDKQLYSNKFINNEQTNFNSNQSKFKEFMNQKNNEILNKSRLPNENLKCNPCDL